MIVTKEAVQEFISELDKIYDGDEYYKFDKLHDLLINVLTQGYDVAYEDAWRTECTWYSPPKKQTMEDK